MQIGKRKHHETSTEIICKSPQEHNKIDDKDIENPAINQHNTDFVNGDIFQNNQALENHETKSVDVDKKNNEESKEQNGLETQSKKKVDTRKFQYE